ncbi:copper oxidase [Sinimarinibacterium sp. CAU 1509]|uniref:multicopper oxidase domain-containing protein n=1 Tax=Sinimarinibacterium sp. CAU 1509 TaxID=2562283 RepID=UPI0010ABF85D|nr:multicopper oxidase domain-containing protein [Sinimarinibacterium sp. CAU 1509]TJY64786.1 copper oxidase [Sinimarinibacterium sp. CAU 1509]
MLPVVWITSVAALMIAGVAALVVFGPSAPRSVGGDTVPEDACPPGTPAHWRDAQTIDGVEIEADPSCEPDDPAVVAAVVKGTNRAVQALMETRLARDAVIKRNDRDGDGDPDDIEIKLEVTELNGFSPNLDVPSLRYPIAPGITPGLWVFSPKVRGMSTTNFLSNDPQPLLRLPAPVIRVEQGDTVTITLENTHYFPHTIHLHGVDHPFVQADGQGNDGVPMISEMATLPGQRHSYRFTPRQTGTFFYHCHVQPQAHILMGLAGMIVVEENRPDNWLQTFNVGAGRVRHRSVASREQYDREYDLHYQDMDRELHNLIQHTNDIRWTAKAMNRDYKIAERSAEYHLLNGHSFPYTLRDSMVVVAPDENVKLRVINTGAEPIYLHPHGHKPTVTHYDGVRLSQSITRDVFEIGPAQRAEFDLSTVNDGLHSYGEGAWFMHDHREPGITTDGISPGGDISLVVYETYLNADGMPKTYGSLATFFNPAYYRGEIPVWAEMAPDLFGDPNVPQAMCTSNPKRDTQK